MERWKNGKIEILGRKPILKFLKFLINKILRRVDENEVRIIRDIYDSFYQELENFSQGR